MDVQKIKTDADFSESVVEPGKILVFSALENGKPVTRYKDSDGNFGTISGGTDTSDATAAASDIAEGKTAYIASGKVTGTATFSGGMDFYKCASVDTAAKTWTGYKAVLTDGVYTFEETVTTGLSYGNGFIPVVNTIYNADVTVQVSTLWGDKVTPTNGLIFYVPLASDSEIASTGQSLSKSGTIAYLTHDGIPCAHFSSSMITATVTDIPIGSAPRTISAWVKSSTSASGQRGYFRYGSMNTRQFCGIDYIGQDTVRFGGFYGDTDYTGEEGWCSQWHHLCIIHDGVNDQIWIDGELKKSAENSRDTTYTAVDIGAAYGMWSGYVAAVRVYDRVLSNDEISALASEFTPAA